MERSMAEEEESFQCVRVCHIEVLYFSHGVLVFYLAQFLQDLRFFASDESISEDKCKIEDHFKLSCSRLVHINPHLTIEEV